jgi:hypothetical protein
MQTWQSYALHSLTDAAGKSSDKSASYVKQPVATKG